ncbi:Bax inhibitor-1/YccA family protein [Paenibacillus mesophilus]|uniref:Bax inhibitor-1/YccA family protein n=1 Tax=Paenibacillus mesophilus TaxID=2582849 RepID=UPI00110D59C7|nr:Bax inhibitor-1/YccA family protein [Paenibacillus mesophilus]TMV49691.1 Bax inhibitor-1/YccA family protein [Paenibacillus mesophilus]
MNWEQQQSYSGEHQSTYNAPFHKLLRMFTLSILVSFIGSFVGMFIPPALFLPLIIVELVMLVAAFFIRRKGKGIGYGFVYTFCLISGITIFPSISYYTAIGGPSLVTTAFLLTGIIFGGLTAYAYYSKRDFSFLGGFLTVGILVLIGFSLIGLFTGGFGGTLGLMIAAFGVIIFSGFILYDISQYKHGLPDEEIPLAVLSLYLNFINLFLYLLRLLGILSSDD